MSKGIRYNLLDGIKVIGTFTMYDRDNLQVELIDGLKTMADVPIDFHRGYFNGERVFDTKTVKRWINDRVIPSCRQNINDFLDAIGIEEYDELSIFLYFKGKCVRDTFHLEPLP